MATEVVVVVVVVVCVCVLCACGAACWCPCVQCVFYRGHVAVHLELPTPN